MEQLSPLTRTFNRRRFVLGAGAALAGAAAITLVGYGDRHHGDPSKSQPQQQNEFVQFGALVVPARQEPIVVPATVAPKSVTAEPTPYDGPIGKLKIQVNDGTRKINVDAAVEAISQNKKNQLDVPQDVHKVGWYKQFGESAKPGHNGNSVFTAHVDWYPDIKGPFHDLFNMKKGDVITIVMGNGTKLEYIVDTNTRYPIDNPDPAKNIPTGDLIWPKDKLADEERITLITCGGRLTRYYPGGPGEYHDRDVVIAKRVQ